MIRKLLQWLFGRWFGPTREEKESEVAKAVTEQDTSKVNAILDDALRRKDD